MWPDVKRGASQAEDRLAARRAGPELGQLNRQIAKLIGVAPLANDSGKHRGRRNIWGGRADVRKVLYMATQAAIRHNPDIKHFAEHLKASGKLPKVLITACMRELLTVMNPCSRPRPRGSRGRALNRLDFEHGCSDRSIAPHRADARAGVE